MALLRRTERQGEAFVDPDPLSAKRRDPVRGPSVSVPSWSRAWRLGDPDGCCRAPAGSRLAPRPHLGQARLETGVQRLLGAAPETPESLQTESQNSRSGWKHCSCSPRSGVGAQEGDLVAIGHAVAVRIGIGQIEAELSRSVTAPSPSPSAP